MPRHRPIVAGNDQGLAQERSLQVAAALVLAFAVLVAVVLRAGVHNVFSAGWWHRW